MDTTGESNSFKFFLVFNIEFCQIWVFYQLTISVKEKKLFQGAGGEVSKILKFLGACQTPVSTGDVPIDSSSDPPDNVPVSTNRNHKHNHEQCT